MPTNQQRRATARRKAERQEGRRTQARARRRRIFVITCGAVAVIGLLAALTIVIVNEKSEQKATATATTSSTTSNIAAPATSIAPAATPTLSALPTFQPPAGVGANCQYPPSQDKAAKAVKPPSGGKVSTDDKTMNATMLTDQGPVGLTLAIYESPCTVHSFVSLAKQGFFNNTKCHRLTTSSSLQVLQCGDPKGDGTGGPGYQFADEYPTNQYPPNDPKRTQPLLYPRGTLAMANAGPDTNGSQFFLVYGDSQLPPAYTVFGTIGPDGLATLDKAAKAGVAGGGEDGAPATAVTIKSVQPE